MTVNDVKNDLQTISKKAALIVSLQQVIENKKRRAESLKNAENVQAEIDLLNVRLSDEINELTKLENRYMNYISRLPVNKRLIVTSHYVNGEKIKTIARRMYYDESWIVKLLKSAMCDLLKMMEEE